MALDRMTATEQAEWLAFDFALRGALPPPPVDPDETPPEFDSPQDRLRWLQARLGR